MLLAVLTVLALAEFIGARFTLRRRRVKRLMSAQLGQIGDGAEAPWDEYGWQHPIPWRLNYGEREPLAIGGKIDNCPAPTVIPSGGARRLG